MTRQTAWEILQKHVKNLVLLKHSLAVEAVMRAVSLRFHGDVQEWGITGLLHDADYEVAKGHPERHGMLLFQLEPNSIPTLVERAIKAHNYEFTKIVPVSPMDWALYCCDELTGIIMAVALSTKGKKLAEVTSEMILAKLSQQEFAKKAHAEKIILCEEKLGIPLKEFVALTLKAMQGIHEELGL